MNILKSIFSRTLLLLLPLCLSLMLSAQPRRKIIPATGPWKLELHSGVGTYLTDVPEKYRFQVNNVNVPVSVPGPLLGFSARKSVHPHFDLGFSVNYMNIHGEVARLDQNFQVRTQTLESSVLYMYNLFKTNGIKTRFNAHLYGKVGNVSIRNEARQRMEDGTLSPHPEKVESNAFIKNFALAAGLGAGFSYQLTPQLGLLTSLDLNRSFELSNEFFRFRKNFAHAANAITNYTGLSVGISYSLGASGPKKSALQPPVKKPGSYFYFTKHHKPSYYHSKKKSRAFASKHRKSSIFHPKKRKSASFATKHHRSSLFHPKRKFNTYKRKNRKK